MAVDRVAFRFDPFRDVKVPESRRDEARELIADFVKEEVLASIGEGKSPVASGKWRKALTPDYKKAKGKVSSVDFANLELKGALLDALEVVEEDGKLVLLVEGKEAGKADGNNRGTYGKKSPIQGGKFKREFIPKRGQTFKKDIWSGINAINRDLKDDEE